MITGLTILCSSNPSLSQMRLSGLSKAGRSSAAIRKIAASAVVHGQIRPACQPLRRLTTANAPAITNPNERSEPATICSSREKLSWVDWVAIRECQRQGAEGRFVRASFRRCGWPGKAEKRPFRGWLPATAAARSRRKLRRHQLQFRQDAFIGYAL